MSQNRNLSVLANNVSTAGVLNPSGGGTGITTTPANGAIPIGNGTNYTAATITAGANITVTNTAGAITIASPTGSGKVLQVAQGVLSTKPSTSSTSFTDTGLTVSITPTSATSKILVMVTIGSTGASNGYATLGLNLVRGSTTIAVGTVPASGTATTMGASNYASRVTLPSQSITYLDSPATTSATTYKVQFASLYSFNSPIVILNGTYDDGGLWAISTYSTITVMEISA
jgi:hypothetical protein